MILKKEDNFKKIVKKQRNINSKALKVKKETKQSYIDSVAEVIGVSKGEMFEIEGKKDIYFYLDDKGLCDEIGVTHAILLVNILLGKVSIIRNIPILNDKEKAYLNNFVSNYLKRNQVLYLERISFKGINKECHVIKIKTTTNEAFHLPIVHDTFQNMEPNHRYTPEELDLMFPLTNPEENERLRPAPVKKEVIESKGKNKEKTKKPKNSKELKEQTQKKIENTEI